MTEKFREVLLIVACAVLATFAAIGWMRQPEPARASEPVVVTAPAADAKAVSAVPVQSYAAPVRSANVAPAHVAPAPAAAARVAQPKKRSLAKSAIIVGAAAGTGAAIGGLAGGGKGAAIGAISGGAAGVIYDRATANKQR